MAVKRGWTTLWSTAGAQHNKKCREPVKGRELKAQQGKRRSATPHSESRTDYIEEGWYCYPYVIYPAEVAALK